MFTKLKSSVKWLARKLCCKKFTNVVQLLVVVQSLIHLNSTLVVFTVMTLVIRILFTTSQSLAMVSMKRHNKSIGWFVTHGVLTGVKLVSSKFAEVSTTLPSKASVLTLSLRTLGLKVLSTSLLSMKKTVVLMTTLFTPSLSLNGKELMFLRTSSQRPKKVVVLRELHSLVVRRRMFHMLGTS